LPDVVIIVINVCEVCCGASGRLVLT